METAVTAICGTILAALQVYTNYRLKQQDNLREAAREEITARAATVKMEALAAAGKIEGQVVQAKADTDEKLDEIHVLVNNRLTQAMERIQGLEGKLGLASGETIPSAAIITEGTPLTEP